MITDNKQFEINEKSKEELLKLLNAYQKAIDINIISSITDTNGNIVHVNDKFCEVSKYSSDELIGQNHRIINSGYHDMDFFIEMWTTIKNGKSWQKEIKNKAKDGSFYWVDTVILPISDNNTNIIQYLSLRTLITEKKRIEEEKKEYIEKLKEMLHIISHNVRAPLAKCMGLMNLVEDDKLLSQEELLKIVRYLKSSAIELNGFTEELTTSMYQLEKKYD